MPLVLEYKTSRSVGRFRLAAHSLDTALDGVSTSLRGLQCLTATLRLLGGRAAFSDGEVIATYTARNGWRMEESMSR